jgi:hypothetical protein
MDGIMELLDERRKTHGDFADHARCTQRLKVVINEEHHRRLCRGQDSLSYEQMEAVAMICHKIGRIIAGDADFADHWDDIAGYAMLCSKPAVPDDILTETFGPIEDYVGEHDGEEVPATSWPYPQDLEHPFTNHRTMAEVMSQEHQATAADRQEPAFGEGDETPEHIHRWRVSQSSDQVMVCDCGEAQPIIPQKFRQYDLKMPEVDDKHACDCDRDRCKIENGWGIGSRVFCRKAEAGR